MKIKFIAVLFVLLAQGILANALTDLEKQTYNRVQEQQAAKEAKAEQKNLERIQKIRERCNAPKPDKCAPKDPCDPNNTLKAKVKKLKPQKPFFLVKKCCDKV